MSLSHLETNRIEGSHGYRIYPIANSSGLVPDGLRPHIFSCLLAYEILFLIIWLRQIEKKRVFKPPFQKSHL